MGGGTCPHMPYVDGATVPLNAAANAYDSSLKAYRKYVRTNKMIFYQICLSINETKEGSSHLFDFGKL